MGGCCNYPQCRLLLAHREYASPGGAVHVAIYSYRVEITNPGTLPPGVELADLKGWHDSTPRNPLIADVLYKRGFIERGGAAHR